MDAPVTPPPKSESRATVPPIAIAAAAPTALVSVATAMITNIKNAVITPSYTSAEPTPTLGTVAPRFAGVPSQTIRKSRAPATAPTSCEGTYAATSRSGKCRVALKATLTAGLM